MGTKKRLTKVPNKLVVKIIKEPVTAWYKIGETHEVNNYVVFDYYGGKPSFEKGFDGNGIFIKNCEILDFIYTYTTKEIETILGHKFRIDD